MTKGQGLTCWSMLLGRHRTQWIHRITLYSLNTLNDHETLYSVEPWNSIDRTFHLGKNNHVSGWTNGVERSETISLYISWNTKEQYCTKWNSIVTTIHNFSLLFRVLDSLTFVYCWRNVFLTKWKVQSACAELTILYIVIHCIYATKCNIPYFMRVQGVWE